jgi:purine nucleosidase
MTVFRTVLLCTFIALVVSACSNGQHPNMPSPPELPEEIPAPPEGDVKQPPVRIILDTDFGIDVDDVGALAITHRLADLDEVELLGVVSNVSDPYSPAAIDVINTYYGRPDVPIGLTTSPYYAEAYPYWRNPSPHYIQTLVGRFAHDTSTNAADISGAVETYRKLLAAQPDASVSLVSIGFLQNLAGLLNSPADEHSPLDGRALIKQKVKELVIMGGHYPNSERDLYLTGGREMDPSYAIDVIENWPTKTVFNTGPVCGEVISGQTLADVTPADNPVRAAYTLFFEEAGRGRSSWDLCSVLYAVRGLSEPNSRYFELHTDEHLKLKPDGHNVWVRPGNDRHERLERVMETEELQTLLEQLLVAPPLN